MHKVEYDYSKLNKEALIQPVPNMDELRLRKGYQLIPIDRMDPRFHEPVVDIANYGLSGQAHYSRPNAATKEPVPDVAPSLYLRKSVAETLAKINTALQNRAITKFFGGEVELYIEDALRSVTLQRLLHDEAIPALLRTNHPTMSEKEIFTRRNDIIATPSTDPNTPPPHATGGAVDVMLRYKQPTRNFVKGSNVFIGHVNGTTDATINPDYFEQIEPKTKNDLLAQRNRRAYYAIMTGTAFEVDTELTNNPTEWWHWGQGDQLSAQIRGDKTAYYSLAEPK